MTKVTLSGLPRREMHRRQFVAHIYVRAVIATATKTATATMTVTATTLAGRAGGRRRLSDSCLRYKKQEKSKSRRLRRHLGTSAPFFLLRGPLPLCLPLQASAAAECNAVHCRPNTVSNNRFTTHTHTPPPLSTRHIALK